MKTIRSLGTSLIVAILLFRSPASHAQSDKRAVVLPPFGAWEIGGIWQPTKEDVAGLEASLEHISRLEAENWPAKSGVHIDHPERYFRQYIGVIRDWKLRIYVNAFCSDLQPSPAWQRRLYQIMDGGTCAWQAIYDPSARRFLSLRINGVG